MMDLMKSDEEMTRYTELHFLIADAIFDYADIWNTSKIRRQDWTKSFATHPYFNLYGCARISILLGLFERTYTKHDQKSSFGSLASRAMKFMLPRVINYRLLANFFIKMRDPSAVTIDEDIELFKTRLANGKLPDKELISFYYTHLPTESEVDKYNTLLDDIHDDFLHLPEDTVSDRFKKYAFKVLAQRMYKGIAVDDLVVGNTKRLSIEDYDHHLEYKCSRRSFRLK